MTHYARPAADAADGAQAGSGVTYLRFTYFGSGSEPEAGRALDPDIVRTLWMSADELRACPERQHGGICEKDNLASRPAVQQGSSGREVAGGEDKIQRIPLAGIDRDVAQLDDRRAERQPRDHGSLAVALVAGLVPIREPASQFVLAGRDLLERETTVRVGPTKVGMIGDK